MNVELYADLYMWMVKLGNPEISIKRSDTEIETIDIGGYGLFVWWKEHVYTLFLIN